MRGSLFVAIISMAFIPFAVMAQGTLPTITSPSGDQVLQGNVSVSGTTDIPNFASAELDFAYASDSTGTWFLIQTFSQPVANSTLATGDTTSISDGDYILRLRVTLQDCSSQDAMVKIKVQNEAPTPALISTMTPTVAFLPTWTAFPSTPTNVVISSTPTPIPFPTPTVLPSNPVELQSSEIYSGIERGGLIILGLFVFFGILIRLRRS